MILYFAILKAGGTVVNFNQLYTEREISAQAADVGVEIMVSLDLAMIQAKIGRLAAAGRFKRVIVCSMAAALPTVKSVLFRLVRRKELARVLQGSPYARFERLIAVAARPAPVQIDPTVDVAVLHFTGGTTGTPKAAMLTHANISANVRQVRAAMPGLAPGQERILAALPFFHVFAMTAVMNLGLDVGAELIMLPRPDIQLLMATIFCTRPTILPGVPTLFTSISNAAEAGNKIDLSFLKYCISGGAEILSFLAKTLNKIEIPKSVEIRDSLPKTLIGKLSKKELIAEAATRTDA